MKAKWVSIVDELRGNVDEKHYVRKIPGNDEWGAVCAKPELSKKTKKKKAEHPTAKGGKIEEGRERDRDIEISRYQNIEIPKYRKEDRHIEIPKENNLETTN